MAPKPALQFDLILYAPTVHTGGGLSLLTLLLEAVPHPPRSVLFLDSRLPSDVLLEVQTRGFAAVHIVRPGLFGRLKAETSLAALSKRARLAFLFGSLPSLFHLLCPTFIYFHNRLILDGRRAPGFSLKNRIRHAVKKLWFELLQNKKDILLVQTPSMRDELSAFLGPRRSFDVLAFYKTPIVTTSDEKRYDFVYVASGDPHKNHDILLSAWELLAKQRLYPSLALTVDEAAYPALTQRIQTVARLKNLDITNLGVVAFKDIGSLYAASRCLVYPSLRESFGLPLIESIDLGLDVIAADLPYVTDVGTPSLTFDPASPDDLVHAITRYLSGSASRPVKTLRTLSAGELWARCLSLAEKT